jgi:hypothetical protein
VSAVTAPPCRGVTLAETLVATVLSGVVVAALHGVLLRGQRFYRAQPQILEVQRGVRAVALLLPAELRGLDASDGDIVAMSDTALTVKAPRALGIVCGEPDLSAGRVTVSDRLLFAFRAIDPARDSALLFRDGDTLRAADDRWIRAGVAGVGAAPCPDGSPGTRLSVTSAGGAAELEGVRAGAPLRTFEMVRYRLYVDGSRTWWLGLQSYTGGWSATTPLAGPLRARDGLRLGFADVDGAPTTVPAAVRRILLSIRGRSLRTIDDAGRRGGSFEDSVFTTVSLRNGARP